MEIVLVGASSSSVRPAAGSVSQRSSCKADSGSLTWGVVATPSHESRCFCKVRVAVVQVSEAREEDEARAARALSLVHMGELSAARQALEGAPVAPGTHATLRALADPERRPALPREPLHAEIANLQPAVPFQLDTDLFLVNLRKSRRGAAPGPSGMHSDLHLFPLLERPRDTELLAPVASAMAVGDIPGWVESHS